ncbi:NAD(P)H-hydrate epimerase [Pantoea ananatis]
MRGADALGISLYELMLRAGQAAYERYNCPLAGCRALAGAVRSAAITEAMVMWFPLAQAAGKQVTLLACDSDKPLPDEAEAARNSWLEAGGVIHAPDVAWPEKVDIIVDALLGTGISRAPARTCFHPDNSGKRT